MTEKEEDKGEKPRRESVFERYSEVLKYLAIGLSIILLLYLAYGANWGYAI